MLISLNLQALKPNFQFSIDGCYRYHLNGKKDSKLGLFIRRNEEDYKIVNFLLKRKKHHC